MANKYKNQQEARSAGEDWYGLIPLTGRAWEELKQVFRFLRLDEKHL